MSARCDACGAANPFMYPCNQQGCPHQHPETDDRYTGLDREMERALEADGDKLRQLTGEDHGPWPRPFRHTVDWQFQRVKDEEGYDIEVLIGYDIEPYVPGKISGPPEDCYPAEGGYVTDLLAFKPGTDEVVELTDEERKEVTDWIERHHDHDERGDPDAAYDAWRDDQMDRRDDSGEDWF